jgi:hypothetical protein
MRVWSHKQREGGKEFNGAVCACLRAFNTTLTQARSFLRRIALNDGSSSERFTVRLNPPASVYEARFSGSAHL